MSEWTIWVCPECGDSVLDGASQIEDFQAYHMHGRPDGRGADSFARDRVEVVPASALDAALEEARRAFEQIEKLLPGGEVNHSDIAWICQRARSALVSGEREDG